MSAQAQWGDRRLLVGISVVRNEEDIVRQALRHAAPLHDAILVVDAGSDDDTIAQVRAVASEFPQVVLLGALAVPARSGQVRRHIWSLFRDHVPPGSWWSIVDADEFAHEDLRRCVMEAEAEGADHVQGAFATFQYMASEARAWREGRETVRDRQRSIEERRRFYNMSVYSVRLFRQRAGLRWNKDTAHPPGLLRPLRRRAHYRHYQHRDLDQLEVRLRTRSTLDLPDEHRRVHYHWHYTVDQAIIPDGSPGLRRHEPGAPLIPDVTLGRARPRLMKRVRAHLEAWRLARSPQDPPAFFRDAPAGELLRRAAGAL